MSGAEPHYIDREAVARIIDPAAFMFSPGELADKVYSASRAHAFDRADRILALIAAPMEAVAWRYPVLTARDEAVARMARAMRNGKAWPAVFQANTAEALAEDALTALEALAVIPTEGGEGPAPALIDSECIHPACGCGDGPCRAIHPDGKVSA